MWVSVQRSPSDGRGGPHGHSDWNGRPSPARRAVVGIGGASRRCRDGLWTAVAVGRRAALVLALPAMTIGLASVLLAATGPLVFTGLPIVTAAVFYGAPLSVLFALGALPRDPEQRPDHG